VITAIRSLRQAINTLREFVAAIKVGPVDAAKIAIPVEEAFLSWANLRPEIQRVGLDSKTLEEIDERFTKLVRLTTGAAPRKSYESELSAVYKLLAEDINDFGIRAALFPAPIASPRILKLIPQISDLPDELVPRPLLGWLPRLKKFLSKSPFENNVFIMVAYRQRTASLLKAVTNVVKQFDLNPVIAKDNELTDDLYNPIANLLCCKYGIAIFDRGDVDQKHNANVVYELAMMQMLQRPCIIVKHSDVASMPSDFLHKLYRSYTTTSEATNCISKWLQSVQNEIDTETESNNPSESIQ
jgi:hypothetical protein